MTYKEFKQIERNVKLIDALRITTALITVITLVLAAIGV